MSFQRKSSSNSKIINSSRSIDQMISSETSKQTSSSSNSLLQSIISGYKSQTSSECKSIDAFLAFTVLTGVAQAVYCVATKGFPYNAFIGVFSASVGSFVFAANVRLQLTRKPNPSNVEKIHLITEFLVCSILLNIFVANFIG